MIILVTKVFLHHLVLSDCKFHSTTNMVSVVPGSAPLKFCSFLFLLGFITQTLPRFITLFTSHLSVYPLLTG